MVIFLAVSIVIIVLLFGLASISQSFAAAKQAQATIETARAAEIAGLGNLLVFLIIALLVIALLWVSIYFILRSKTLFQQSIQKSNSSRTPEADTFPWQNLATLLVLRMLQNQIERDASQLHFPPTEVEAPTDDFDFWLLP